MAVGDDASALADDEVARGPPDVVAVIGVGGVPDDALVLFVERVHRPPGERDPALEDRGVGGEIDVLPRGALGDRATGPDDEPRGGPEVAVPGVVAHHLERAGREIGEGEVGHRIAAGLVEQHDVLAVGDPLPAEPHPQPTS